MRLIAWDPDVETVISRIEAKVLDLQPGFQRGEVWSKSKKQRLIDSILRDWHVPPLHVVENPTTKVQEVLDGQQRLVAIRDFVRGAFEVDGDIEPSDPNIKRLDGLKYKDLPPDAKGQFDRFSLRVYRIVDFKTTEPAELFFRLNQPTNLTAAEQRNAFIGPVREQIKNLVKQFPSYGLDKDIINFSNARMAYDDVLCRVGLTLERRSISLKIGSSDLVELYRTDKPLSEETLQLLQSTLILFGTSGRNAHAIPKFNKATLYSWLVFFARGYISSPNEIMDESIMSGFMEFFETNIFISSIGGIPNNQSWGGLPAEWVIKVYSDRSTSRVADVSSVVLRDIALWMAFTDYISTIYPSSRDNLPTDILKKMVETLPPSWTEDDIARHAINLGWGDLS